MSSLFSTFTMENGGYVGIVYNSSNNSQVYKTTSYPTQVLAMRDVNNFVKNAQVNNPTAGSQSHSATGSTTPATPRRCCGR